MDTIFMNLKNSKTSDLHILLCNLRDKKNYKKVKKCSSIQYWHIIYIIKHKKLCKNNKFEMPAQMWNKGFQLTDRSYPTWDIQNHFEFLLKKHGIKTVNPSITIYIYKIKIRITLKIKAGYYLELLISETINVLECTKIKITKKKNAENYLIYKLVK